MAFVTTPGMRKAKTYECGYVAEIMAEKRRNDRIRRLATPIASRSAPRIFAIFSGEPSPFWIDWITDYLHAHAKD